MKRRLARLAYSTLLRLLTPALLLRLLWRARREPVYGSDLGQRLGGGEGTAAGAIWIHAVSLGETRAAEPLIQALRQLDPTMRLLLTQGTATGREAGAALLGPADAQRWLPFDTPGAVRRFLRRHRPAVGVLMETEVWPNLQAEAAAAGVPMLLVNARLSAKSLRQSLRFDALLRPAAEAMTLALAQTEADAQRLRAAGAPDVRVAGNLKFDQRPDLALLARGRLWRAALGGRPVILAASWREGEDEPLLRAWLSVQAEAAVGALDASTRPLLLLVPRHPQRFDGVAGLVQAAGLRLARRSAWPVSADGSSIPTDFDADVWLGDSMREMAAYYALADVALLGGSFAPLGGQNLIEAAACGCPVVMGPHTFNFEQAALLSQACGAARRVVDLDAAVWLACEIAADAERRTHAATASLAFAAAHQGAAECTAREVLRAAAADPA